MMLQTNKQFGPSNWAISNRTTIYILSIFLTLFGITAYNELPKESFPEVVIPTIYVSTVYPGTSPTDMENLVTRVIENEIKSVSGISRVTSNSLQDFSNVVVEFNTDVEVAIAKRKISDAVDKVRTDLPSDLPQEPQVMEIDFSEIPIMMINMSGDIDLDKLKKFADDTKDRIEQLREVTRVDIIGAMEREIQVDVDMFRMDAARIAMRDIESAIMYENMTISGGNIDMGDIQRSLRVVGEFTNTDQLGGIIVKSLDGNPVYLRDIATITDGYKQKESYARLDGQNVVTLNVVKRSGENLVIASDKINEIINEMTTSFYPPGMKVTITGDQSRQTRHTLSELINTIIIGFILVTIVLMFFMGITNAIFVGLSVPLSSLIAFLVMPGIDFSLNMIVLFSFLFALGIIVDDAIVVIENTYRIFNKGRVKIADAARSAAGEVFVPVLAGTLTTLAPFVPLAFWPGVVGKFMYYLPVTLIITLIASLVVAFIINPVFAVSFMKSDEVDRSSDKRKNRGFIMVALIMAVMALVFHLSGSHGIGNFIICLILLGYLNKYVLKKLIRGFEEKVLPAMMNAYEKLLHWVLKGKRAYYVVLSTFVLLIFTFMFTAARKPPVVFFPTGNPNYVYVYLNLPIGTDAAATDSVIRMIEKKVYRVLGENNPIVDAVISNVAVGAGDPMQMDRSIAPHKGKITIAFVEYKYRNGESTVDYLEKIRETVKGIPGAEISVDQEQGGPPTGKPINIEISGDNFTELIRLSNGFIQYIDSLGIQGIEELKSDMESNKPEIIVSVDRERANREGVSTAQIGGAIRNAVYGKEVSKFREKEDQYPIQLRFLPEQRNNVDALLNMRITFQDMAKGGLVRQIPVASLAHVEYVNSYGAIKRKNQKRVVTISSNVLTGYNANEVVQNIQGVMPDFNVPEGYTVSFTGASEEQDESQAFLSRSLYISLGLIFLILVTQFNSFARTMIILSQIIFSIIGVLLGFSLFRMEVSIVMTGIGIVALAGIVVKNGILVVEFTDILKNTGMRTRQAIVDGGKTRLKPVLLTAISTCLGLVPLAIGFNINFETLFAELNPQIYLGGDSSVFWKPLSWTIIFGLGFATLLTLFVVPAMYFIMVAFKVRSGRFLKKVGFKPS